MRPTGLTANLNVADIEEAKEFYTDYLGLSVEEMNLGWVARFKTPDGRAVVQLVSGDATAPVDSVLSIHVGDEVEDRWGDLNQSGIAPEAVILFPETSVPTCIVGVESCGVGFTNDPVRTFWYQRNTEGTTD